MNLTVAVVMHQPEIREVFRARIVKIFELVFPPKVMPLSSPIL
jgi:hypothetical protein